MVKVSYLFWTLLVALVTSGLSYFYVRAENFQAFHGYPLWFYKNLSLPLGGGGLDGSLVASSLQRGINPDYFNWLLFSADLIFWWLIFSILLVILMNYVFDGN